MNGIGQYLYYLFIAAGGAAMCVMLAPEGNGGGMKRHIRYAAGLCICVCLLLPLKKNLSFDGLLSGWSNDTGQTQSQPTYEEITTAYQVGKLEEALQEEIERQYGLGGVRITLAIDCSDPQNIQITDLSLFFPLDVPRRQQEKISETVHSWLGMEKNRGNAK